MGKLREVFDSSFFSVGASFAGVAAAVILRVHLNVSSALLALPLIYLLLLSCLLKASAYPLAGAALWCVAAAVSGLAGDNLVFNGDIVKIVLACVLLSSCGMLVTLSGGAAAAARYIASNTQTRRELFGSVLLTGALCSMVPEIGAAVSGSVFSKVSEKMGVSAEKLSLVAGISACLLGNMFFISVWTAGSIGAARAGLDSIGGQAIPTFDFLVTSIQYNFFALSALVILIMSVFHLRDMGGIYKAECAARNGFRVKQLMIDVSDEEQKKGLIYFAAPFAVFLAVLVLCMLPAGMQGEHSGARGFHQALNNMVLTLPWGSALLIASAAALAVSAGIYLRTRRNPSAFSPAGRPANRKTATFCAEYTVRLAISLCAMFFLCDSGFYSGLAQHISLDVSTALIPVLCFAAAALTGFISGNYAVACTTILPFAISVCWLGMPEQAMYYTMGTGAVFSGALAGVLLSPCAPINIIAAFSAGCSLKAHMWTQAQYVLLSMVLSCVFGFFPLSIGFGTTFGLVVVVGASYAAYDCLSKKPDSVKK